MGPGHRRSSKDALWLLSVGCYGLLYAKGKQVGKIEKMVQRVSCKDKFFPISFYDFFWSGGWAGLV